MAIAPLSELLEQNLKTACHDSWAVSIPAPSFHGGLGGLLPEFPAIKFKLLSTEEFEEVKRNFFCDIEIDLSSPLQLEPWTSGVGAYEYEEQISKHISVAGTIDDWVENTLQTSDLENTISGYTNSLTVYEIKLTQIYTDIETADMFLQHKWTLHVALFYGTQV